MRTVSCIFAVLVSAASFAQPSYTVEVLEALMPWQYVTFLDNERSDYAIVYQASTQQPVPLTVADIDGQRIVLKSFQATSMNVHGDMCGIFRDGFGVSRGVVWTRLGGFRILAGSDKAYPYVIGDDGTVGGAAGHWTSPALWRNGVRLEPIDGVGGIVTALDGPGGLIAGHFPDGGHGDYPWVYSNGTAVSHGSLNFACRRFFSDGTLLGQRSSSYSGSAWIVDFNTLEMIRIWNGNSHWVADMNNSFLGVGATFHDIGFGAARPVIWQRTSAKEFTRFSVYSVISTRWADAWLYRINDSGLILGTARLNNTGPRLLIRLRPKG